jgi:lysophospholipase L1-like esterase
MKIRNLNQTSLGILLALAACSNTSKETKVAPSPPPAFVVPSQFSQFHPKPAPVPNGPLLQKADRLAICGDSITEQKMYSRIMETYLTVAQPDLAISVRQFGWSGETASGFLARMTNDCLRFQPTVATTCYGMNDHGYRVYEDAIGQKYREMSTAIVEAFKTNGARVIQGSPGCVGKTPSWSKDTNAATEALNLNLCELRNIGIDIAQREQIGFADVFWPMLMSGYAAQEKYGTNYAIAGGDGVHPDWAGHLVMAYAFLHSFGLNGDIGTFTIDLKADKAKASAGHEVLSFSKGALQIKSTRYPFCAKGDLKKHNSIRSGMTLVPFNQELNRLTLVVKNAKEKSYVVAWGTETKIYSAEQLAKGVNLADDFQENPFSEAFKKVNDAVKAKQEYETKQIKQLFHGEEGKNDMEATAAKTEKEREPLVAAIKKAFVPVTHVIRIEAN